MRAIGKAQQGFSLVEVVVALGLLASVLISVAGLFVVGNRHVISGRHSSEALAVAREIMEEIDGWGFHQTYGMLGGAGSETGLAVDSRNLSADEFVWQGDLDRMLHALSSRAVIRVESADGLDFASTSAILIRVTVHWKEGRRDRHVELATVRL